jgi:hypothetical protein
LVQFEGVSIYVVSVEDLILSKLYWAKDSLSEMQIKDVKNLIQNNPKLNREYIQLWVERLNLSDIYQKLEQ